MGFEVFKSGAVKVSDIVAAPGQRPDLCDDCRAGFQIAFIRSGTLVRRMDGRREIANSAGVMFFKRGDPYDLAPFGHQGVACTILSFGHDVIAPQQSAVLTGRPVVGLAGQAGIVALQVLAAARAKARELVVDEASIGLARQFGRLAGASIRKPSPAEHKIAENVRTCIAASPLQRHTLSALAKQSGISPYHLAHVFRAVTGSSIGRYQMRLKLNLALERIAEGERSLLRLAKSLGFSSHSHLTRKFHDHFGMPPSKARRLITACD